MEIKKMDLSGHKTGNNGKTISADQSNVLEDAGEVVEKETGLLIIGGGPGGYEAAIYAAKRGEQVTLIEKNRMGGTCLNVGCIPTKTLIKSAEVFEHITRAQEFGIRLEAEPSADLEAMIARKDSVVDRLVGGIEFLMKKNKIEILHGEASFEDEKHIKVCGEKNYRCTFQSLIIATGSNIAEVNIPGIELPFVLNSTTALNNTDMPQRLVIIGGGVIGLEMAFLYRSLGAEVTVIEFLDRLLPMVDGDASREILRQAKKKGIKVLLSSKVTKIQEAADKSGIVTFQKKEKESVVMCDKLIVAIGRTPNIEGLNIEASGIELNEGGRGIKADSHMQTNRADVYAIGDVNNMIQLAHVASHQGICAVKNILGEAEEFDVSAVPSVIFTSPEAACVGMTEEDAKKAEMTYRTGKFNFNANGKAVSMGETDGYCKLIMNEKNEIIGGSVVGPDASTLIDTITLAVRNHLTDEDITKTIFPHPTTGEVICEAAYALSIGTINA